MNTVIKDVFYGKNEVQKLDIYIGTSRNTIVYIHGGGLEAGSKDGLPPLLEEFIKRDYSVISVNYSLYPDAKFPDFIEDCALALKFVKDNAELYGYGENICVIGGSAGAYISLMLYFDEHYLGQYGLSAKDFYGFLIDSAQPTAHYNVLREKGLETYAIRVDETAPIYFLNKKDYGSKLYIVTYTNDIFCRKEQNEMLDKTLTSYGISHEFYILEGTHCSGEQVDKNGQIKLLPIVEKLFN